ncbi:MAG: replicative DNA helicase [bacterium]|nr:replicative DNA helicase [bacterium]
MPVKSEFVSGVRIPPQDIEAEQALLGSIMLNPGVMHEVADGLSDEMYYAEKHRIIYRAMFTLFGKSEPIDLVTLSTWLKDKGKIEQIGGASYLSQIVNVVPSAGNAEYYADIVRRKYVMRCLIQASEAISSIGYNEAEDNTDLMLDQAEKQIFQVTNATTTGKNKFINIKSTLDEAWERLDRLHNTKEEIRGVPTGFKELDHKLAGLQKSDLVILAARPSMGKTSLALDIVRNAALNHNHSVGIFSLEMSSQQLVDRMLAAVSRVDSWKLRTGKLSTDEEFGLIQDAMSKLAAAPIYIDDDSSNSIIRMRTVARRLKREVGLDLIVVDYLQLMVPATSSDSLVHQVTEISRSLKGLARELDVPVLALSQLSRAVESRGGEPRLSDLRDSGCLTGDTLITRADTGERVQIKELVGKKNIPIFALDESYRILKTNALKIFYSGRKTTYELVLRSGKTIKASANHPFLTIEGWKRLDELKTKTPIATPRKLTIKQQSTSVSNDEIILLAHLIGDGCTVPRQPIHYTSADPANLDAVEQAELLADNNLKNLSCSDVYWDEVASITKLDEDDVYDIEVPGLHNFVANDIIVHNSIEQDADVVMFIHREKNRNEEVDSSAKVIIAKHRNGPTGEASLAFDAKRVSFIELDTHSDFGGF